MKCSDSPVPDKSSAPPQQSFLFKKKDAFLADSFTCITAASGEVSITLLTMQQSKW